MSVHLATRVMRYSDFWRWELRRLWYLYLTIGLIWVLACIRMLGDPTPHVPLLFNWTPSLPYRVLWLRSGTPTLKRGELILYRFEGPAKRLTPGLRGQPFLKRIRGVPGDTVSVQGRAVAINGETVGVAKPIARNGAPLTPIAPGRIPADRYYVQGDSADAFDSRYQASGLVWAEQVIGTVRPLW